MRPLTFYYYLDNGVYYYSDDVPSLRPYSTEQVIVANVLRIPYRASFYRINSTDAEHVHSRFRSFDNIQVGHQGWDLQEY